MSVVNNSIIAGASGSGSVYEIEQSLRFDGGSHLSRTFGSTGNGRIWSLSVWVKRAGGIGDNDRDIFGAYTGSYSRIGLVECGSGGGDADLFGLDQGGPSSNGGYYVKGRRRDPYAWYHLVISVNYNTPSAKIWVNGVLQEQSINALAADGGLINSSGVPHHIGSRVTGPSGNNRWLGYMAEFHFLDTDSQLSDPNDFGEFDDNGVWRPIEYTGSYGDNGFYMKFDPSATNGIGHDHSGNGNHFTSNGGFDTTNSGANTYDVMSDTPTTNYCTLNPLNTLDGNFTYSNGNLDASSTTGWYVTASTFFNTSGKWYFEYTANTDSVSDGHIVGVTAYPWPSNNLGTGSTGYGYQMSQRKWNNGSYSTYGASWTTGDVIGVAYDLDNKQITFYKNGSTQGVAFTGITSEPVSPAISIYNGTGSINFGQRAFAYTPPTGYKALNTANLPAPNIANGSEYFNTVLWDGNATARDITTGHNSNLTWIKHRNSTDNHNLFDILRGAGKRLESNSQDYEVNYTDRLTAFNSDGFSLGTGYNNSNTRTYVGWSWAGGGTGSSIATGSVDGTNPTIASTVSANTTAGFSIVSWTGTNVAATVGHGLGATPSFIITRNLDSNSVDWRVQHASLGPTKYLNLNKANYENAASSVWNNTAPTSTVFSVANDGGSNGSGQRMITYCFAEIEGYSKFGSYERNGSSDGPVIHLGFTPALIIIKEYAAGTEGWSIYDNKRLGYNPNDTPMLINADSSETYIQNTYANEIDFLSDGFKIRTSDSRLNSTLSTYKYVYAAFASNPFGGAGVSPATAR